MADSGYGTRSVSASGGVNRLGTARGRRLYYCHECERTTTPTSDEMMCHHCNGEFIEEMNAPGASAVTEEGDTETGNAVSSHQASAQPPSSQMPSGRSYVFRMRGGSSGGRPFQVIMEDFELPRAGAPNAAFRNPLEAILSQVFGGFGGGGLTMPHGNIGDYAWGPGGLDAIITQLLNHADNAGPPPADQEKIDSIPTVKISREQVESKLECSVCFDEFKVNEEVKLLPCKHHFHEDCIIPWLGMHGTCPVCRKDLNGDDTTTQEFDASIGETISSLNAQQNNSNSGDIPLQEMGETQTNATRDSVHTRHTAASTSEMEPMVQDEEVD